MGLIQKILEGAAQATWSICLNVLSADVPLDKPAKRLQKKG